MGKKRKTPQEQAAGFDIESLLADVERGSNSSTNGGSGYTGMRSHGLGYGVLGGGGGGGGEGPSLSEKLAGGSLPAPAIRSSSGHSYPLDGSEEPLTRQTDQTIIPSGVSKGETAIRTAAEGLVPGVHAVKGALAGVGENFGDWLAETTHPGIAPGLSAGEHFTRNVDQNTEALARSQQDNPEVALATGIATSFIPGSPLNVVGKGVQASRMAKLAPILTGAAMGAGTAAVQTAGAGGDLGDVGESMKGGAFVGGASAPIAGLIGRAAGALKGKISSDATQRGRGIQAAERLYGDEAVGLRVKGAEGIKDGERGIVQLAGKSEDELQAIGAKRKLAASQEYEAATAGLGDKRVDPLMLRVGLDNAIRATKAENGTILFPELRTKLETARKALNNSPSGLVSPTGDTLMSADVSTVPVKDILSIKQMLDLDANWGMPATKAQKQLQDASTSFANMIAKVEPKLGEAQARYAERMGELERYNTAVYGKDAAGVADSVTNRERAVRRLSSQGLGENSVPAAQIEEGLDAGRQEFPEMGPLLDLPLAERFKQGSGLSGFRASVGPDGKPIVRSSVGALEDIALTRGAYPALRQTGRAAAALPASGNLMYRAAKRKKKDDKE